MSGLRNARLRRLVSAHPVAATATAYAIVAAAAAAAAFFALFTQFAFYDDEGTLLVTVQAFIHGDTLYRDIITAYGPFYYELFGGFFSLVGHAVTTDASRSIVLVVWVSASLLFGLAAQRLTGLLWLGLSGMIAAFGALTVLSAEPMHPHGLGALLLAVFVLLAVAGPGRRVALAGGICGALLAALALTKINLGIFAVAAVALAAVLTVEPLHRRRWLRWLVVAGFLAMPIAVTARDLSQAWVRDLIALEVLAAIAIVVAASPLAPPSGEDDAGVSRWVLGAIAGFAAAFLAILGILLLTGPTPADIYDGVVGEALEVRNLILGPIDLSSTVVEWGIVTLAAAVLAIRLRPREAGVPGVWPGLLRVLAGATIWLAAAHVAPLEFSSTRGDQDALPLVLAWVAVVPPRGVVEAPYRRFLRVLLPALAAAETLQVYPVAGSQMGIAAVCFVPVGALCLADGLASLRAWGVARGAQAREQLAAVVSVAAVSLAAVLAYQSILRPGFTNAVDYRHGTELSLPGASLMRLDPGEAELYEGLVYQLQLHHCTGLIGYPSINSLYLWSGIEAPPPQVPGTWMKALDGEQQQRVVDELRASPRPCAVRSDGRAETWLQGAPPPPGPLVSYVFEDFRPVATVGDFQFLLPRAGRALRRVE
jgi:hypothetical protein